MLTAEQFLKSQANAPTLTGYEDILIVTAIALVFVFGCSLGYLFGRRAGYRVAARVMTIVNNYIGKQRQLAKGDLHRVTKNIGEKIAEGVLAASPEKLAAFERELEELSRER